MSIDGKWKKQAKQKQPTETVSYVHTDLMPQIQDVL